MENIKLFLLCFMLLVGNASANNLAFPPLETEEDGQQMQMQHQYETMTPQSYYSQSTPSYFYQPRYVFPDLENPIGGNPMYSKYYYPHAERKQQRIKENKAKTDEYLMEKQMQQAYQNMLEDYYYKNNYSYPAPTYPGSARHNKFRNSANRTPFDQGFPGFGKNGFWGNSTSNNNNYFPFSKGFFPF